MKHIDDWLDEIEHTLPPGTAYAKWWLEQFRFPAWKKFLYSEFMKPYKLFCDYKGKRYRCTGASRMGDVWLTSNFDKETGYDLRIDVMDCSNWGDKP